jgi:hypothetical protein
MAISFFLGAPTVLDNFQKEEETNFGNHKNPEKAGCELPAIGKALGVPFLFRDLLPLPLISQNHKNLSDRHTGQRSNNISSQVVS